MDNQVSDQEEKKGLVSHISRRRLREWREYITGYLMIAPATILIFIFGIFPVGFALYVSMQKWRLKRGDFVGLSNYTNAIGNLAYFTNLCDRYRRARFLVHSIAKYLQENGKPTWPLLAF